MNTESTETFAELGIPVNPFPGLRPFDFNESHLFFGRDGQSEQLISKLGHTHFLAVVGTSGSGKSSLVRAGMMPALLGGYMSSAGSNWRIAIMRPGNDPIGNLARALNEPDVFGSDIKENAALQTILAESTLQRGSRGLVDTVRQSMVAENENLLVIVDQFEEIFRFARVAEDKEYSNEAAAFVKLLLEAASQRELPIYVVLTMRSDYLGDCAQFWGLPEAINESQYLIPRLTRDQLKEAMTGPISVAQGKITPRLLARLLNDVGDNQDQLPVLQHLLMRVWIECKEQELEIEVEEGDATVKVPHRRVHHGDALDVCCYDAVGGMAKALSRHADEAFNELPNDDARKIAEWLFQALTEKGTDNREIRRPVTLGEICAVLGSSETEVSAVIDMFRRPGRSFLMPSAEVRLNTESLIDISHESLIRGWDRLRQWVDDEARSARIYMRVAETAVLHGEGGAGLWRDPDLQIALTWREQSQPNEVWARRYHPKFRLAMDFLDDSVAARDAEVKKEEVRRKKEIRNTRLTALVFFVGFLASLAAGSYAYVQSKKAKLAQQEAETQATNARLSSIEAEKQRGIALIEKEGAVVSLKLAEAAQSDALEQTKAAEAAQKLAQSNLALANRQKLLAQQASERVKAEALKGQGLGALKEGNESAALDYFNQLYQHYQNPKNRNEAGQSFALASIADVYRDRVPFAVLNKDFEDPGDPNDEEQVTAKALKQYIQSYMIALQSADKDEDVVKAEVINNAHAAFKKYNEALAANERATNQSSPDIALRRGEIFQNLGDLTLLELSDDLEGFDPLGETKTKRNPQAVLERAMNYYSSAGAAYQQAGDLRREADLINQLAGLLYRQHKDDAKQETAGYTNQQAPEVQLKNLVFVYERASTQYERAGEPMRAAELLVRISTILKDLAEEPTERKNVNYYLHRAILAYEEASKQFRSKGDSLHEAVALMRIADILKSVSAEESELRNAISYLEKARDVYRGSKNYSKEATVDERIAQIYGDLSETNEQISALKDGVKAHLNFAAIKPKKRSESVALATQLFSRLGPMLSQSTDPEAASRFFDELVSGSNDPLYKANVFGMIAQYYKGKDEEKVIQYLNQKRDAYKQAGDFFEEGNTLLEINVQYRTQKPDGTTRRLDDANKALDAALVAFRQVDMEKTQYYSLSTNLMTIARNFAGSDKQKAIATYEEVLTRDRDMSIYTVTSVITDAGKILLETKSPEGNSKAKEFFEKAAASRPREQQAEVRIAIGDVYQNAGDKKEARASYTQAATLFRGGNTFGTFRHVETLKKIAALDIGETPGRTIGDVFLSEAESARRANDVPLQALALQIAGLFYRDAKADQKALDTLQQARQLYKQASMKTREATILRVMANIYDVKKDDANAKELRRQAGLLGPQNEPLP